MAYRFVPRARSVALGASPLDATVVLNGLCFPWSLIANIAAAAAAANPQLRCGRALCAWS